MGIKTFKFERVPGHASSFLGYIVHRIVETLVAMMSFNTGESLIVGGLRYHLNITIPMLALYLTDPSSILIVSIMHML